MVSCGVRWSEAGLSEIRKPQVVRSIRIAGSIPTGAKSLTVKGESEARPSLLLYKGIALIEAAPPPSILLPVIPAHATLVLSLAA